MKIPIQSEDLRYNVQIVAAIFLVIGAFLGLEHNLQWGGSDLVWGHEWAAVIIFFFGTVLGILSRKSDTK